MQSLSFTSGLNEALPETFSAPASWINVQKMDMRGCSLLAADYSALLHCMAELQHLTYLDFSAIDLMNPKDSSANAHATYTSGLRFVTIKHLGLPVGCAVDEVCAALVDPLPSSTSLTSLILLVHPTATYHCRVWATHVSCCRLLLGCPISLRSHVVRCLLGQLFLKVQLSRQQLQSLCPYVA